MATAKDVPVRFIPSAAKALEAILWLADRKPGISVYHLVKAVFFADEWHITRFGRPAIADDYRAAPFGPLPQVVYGLLRDDPIERLALGDNGGPLPFTLDGQFRVHAMRGPNLAKLSASDRDALAHGLTCVDGRSFDELYRMTHRHPAWTNARGIMDYRDFLPANLPDRERRIEFIEDFATEAVV